MIKTNWTQRYLKFPKNLQLGRFITIKENIIHIPKSRIPVSKCSQERRLENYAINSRIFPLEPREIDLEFFQQLHTVDSQDELQEFLLLESQCSGNFGLAGDISTSYNKYCTEDDRGTVSGRI